MILFYTTAERESEQSLGYHLGRTTDLWCGERWSHECCENVAALAASQAARVLRPRGHTNPLEFFRGGSDGGGRNNAWDEAVLCWF